MPHQIIIELTERVTENNEIRIEHINELKQYGFILSMDDFSVGNSLLN